MEQNTETKVCTRCKEEKLKWIEFAIVQRKNRPNPQVRPQCRKCRSTYEMERRDKDREAFLERQKRWRESNKEKIKSYHEDKKEANLERFKSYRETNKEQIKAYKVAYNKKPENKAKRNEKQRERRQQDKVFQIMCNIRTRIHNILKQNKTERTDKLLGCTKTQLISWLQYQFSDDLDWSNYGTEWHIDHVIPLAFFDLLNKEQQLLAFNWSNLRPLNAPENLSKNDTIVQTAIINHSSNLTKFVLNNEGYQNNTSTCWSLRLAQSDGKNSRDDGNFESFLKWIISNEYTTFND